jgi:hypothetical protein
VRYTDDRAAQLGKLTPSVRRPRSSFPVHPAPSGPVRTQLKMFRSLGPGCPRLGFVSLFRHPVSVRRGGRAQSSGASIGRDLSTEKRVHFFSFASYVYTSAELLLPARFTGAGKTKHDGRPGAHLCLYERALARIYLWAGEGVQKKRTIRRGRAGFGRKRSTLLGRERKRLGEDAATRSFPPQKTAKRAKRAKPEFDRTESTRGREAPPR